MKKNLLILLLLVACQSQKTDAPAAVEPIPTARQLAWQELEFYGFVHFNMNTFSDMEWGMGDESPSQFNPTALDTRQWAKTVKDAGMKGIIITAKHHDGFCLWPSAYTDHSVKNSPWREGKGDLIRELADACAEYGLKMGIYYSPWDRNHADYGKPEYIDYMRNQLTELLTHYGDVFEVWFDGANGGTGYYGGANEERRVDKKSYYDWENTFGLVRELQPEAVIFGDAGPDVRWVGNEEGIAYETTWSNLMRDSVYAGMPEYSEKYASGQENGSHWVPAESDVSIRPGWYYHEYEDHKVKSLPALLDIYYNSIGKNSSLLINFPVDRRGLIHERDVEQILKLSTKIKEDFAIDLAQNAEISTSNARGKGFEGKQVLNSEKDTYWAAEDGVLENTITLAFEKPITFNRFVVQEYIPLGQRVKTFSLEIETETGWKEIAKGTTIGFKRILRLDDFTTGKIRLVIQDAKASPTISSIGIFNAPKLVVEPNLLRDKSGNINLLVPEKGVDIFYTLDGTAPDKSSHRFEKSFQIKEPTILKMISIDPKTGKSSEMVQENLDIAKANWKVIHMDEKAQNLIDEDPNTFWTSTGNEAVIDLGALIQTQGFAYLPPQNRYMSGVIQEYLFEGSLDGKKWTTLSKGEFSNIANNPIKQEVSFNPVSVKFIKLKAIKTSDGKNAAFAELGVISRKNQGDNL
ncbi:hypothetical protein P872_05620 [Rhodonellum psychrophilum GCM71 = DSM 17998]|uniref:alpha-L-fucosidase n=2 Tax=Rhodonellum TaxID=336827 RepID=U5C1Y7_9BACT|nr:MULTISPECIES: alpha-L-fucosidase [Rhodonellum]ERM82926.1 hypothetical protein P872_05620 [Rhodonellum psychrophilum GCM71 = DSM 17998]SDY48362.1 alpha-L-fucosidase [Rhodonellum ikkaensis]